MSVELEGRGAGVWGVGNFSANLWRAKEVNNRTMEHIEFSSFSAFEERRSVSRDVEKGACIYIHPKDYEEKNVSKFLTRFV